MRNRVQSQSTPISCWGPGSSDGTLCRGLQYHQEILMSNSDFPTGRCSKVPEFDVPQIIIIGFAFVLWVIALQWMGKYLRTLP
jgi:hypothetical protein